MGTPPDSSASSFIQGRRDPRRRAIAVRWEAIAKGTAAVALIAYVVGLIAVALYLEKLDVPLPDLAALKPRFAYTGALVLAGLAVVALPAAIAVADWKHERRATILSVLGLLALAALLWLGFLYVLHRDQPAFWTRASLSVAGQLVLYATAVGVLASVIYIISDTDKDRSVRVASSALALLVFAVLFLYTFSREVLPRIPSQFGGVQPARTHLLFAADAVADAKAIGVAFGPHTTLSAPVSVLYEGDQYYVLRLGPKRIVQIAQDNVVGSITDSTRPVPKQVYTVDRGGHLGVPEPRDQIVLAFSESMDPASVLPGWDGRKLTAILKVARTAQRQVESVTVLGPTKARTHLGRILLRAATLAPRRDQFVGATIRMVGSHIAMTLDRSVRRQSLMGRVESWTASPEATDLSGNNVISRTTHAADDEGSGPGSGAHF
jgi:hypothetical protein